MQNFTELYEVERRYEELAHRMSTPDAAANADEYARMMRDYKELTPLIEEYRRYTDLQQQEADAKEMLAAESDPAFAAMVQQELCEIGRNLAQSEENLRLLLIPKDADDEKSVIYYAINNMADELFNTLYLYEKIIDASGNIVFMVNVEDENEEAFIEDVKFVCTLLSDIMTKEFSVRVGISISSLKKGIESLANSYNEAITALSASCENITDYRDIQSNRALKMISDIEKYIDAHYMNNNLSNTVIADEFNITGQYLSVLFKKHKGENLQNYIARVRVDYAKELLKNDKYTVFQVANMVGYSNDIGFIRVFKKLEGITPGKYRQMNTNKEN